MTWLVQNLGTIVVSLVLLTVIGCIIRGMVQNRKKGKSSCGCGCSGCAMSGTCNKQG